jgi:predicted nucleotidyltransferase
MIDFAKFIKILNDNRVEYVLIGGAAMVIHGSAYVTRDVDICYRRSKDNIRRLAAALRPLNPKLREAPESVPFQLDEATIQMGLNFTLKTDLGDIDLLGEVLPLGFYDSVLAASRSLEFMGLECQVLSLDGIIESKKLAGRRKDLMALPELEALRELKKAKGEQ